MKNRAATVVTVVLAAILAFPGAIKAEEEISMQTEAVIPEEAPAVTAEVTPAPGKLYIIFPDPTAEPLNDADFVFVYGETEAALGDSPEELVNEIAFTEGRPPQIEYGYHNVFADHAKAYNTREITVQSGKGSVTPEEITGIYVDTDIVKTRRGIGVGDALSDVIRLYGEDYTVFMDTIIYKTADEKALIFQIDSDTKTVYSYALLKDGKMPKTVEK